MAGKVVHFEIPVDNGERAVTFYSHAFGWHLEREGPMAYWTTSAGEGEGIGGALTQRDPQAPVLSFYIEVDDIEDALRAIESAGGRRLSGRLPIPSVGWTAFFADTEGNRLGLFQADASAVTNMGIPPNIG